MKSVQVNLAHKQILVRDETARVIQAAEIMRWLSQGQAQTVVEFQLLEVSSSHMRTLGILPTQSFSLTPLGLRLGPLTLTPGTLAAAASAATFGGGGTLMALTMPSAAALAVMSDAKTRSLQDILSRGSDNSPATFTVGERYPIVSAVVTYAAASASGTSSAGIAGNSVPSFTYADIGLKIKVTPHVHANGDVSLILEATSTAIGTIDTNGNPTIENREFSSTMRLREGEDVIVSGMRMQSKSLTLTGLAGLADIPGLGLLFGQRATNDDDDDLLMIIKPHVVRMGPAQSGVSQAIAAPEHTLPVLK
jgi:general secretion pathway protein D